ncbi:S-adenosyl-L-methionine-dependent methyltransferase [Staphylotrichum tortipilum]|uniref:S-adenosyl-L-methionine-dependent methyltransferase n=1 Tax=Staphylotrichum tortipilum TaxID=2831512 RepID=A0AAN6RQ53_9PEZI|nr:S-adenosyl-L-methionine-dependent methyltransferase [Staphylotrichum longicolle]
MATTPRITAELQKLYQNLKTAVGSAWEATLLENARSVSTPLAARMLSQMGLGADTTAPFKLFENACGVGVVAPLLKQIVKPDVLGQSSILCGDFSEQAVDFAKRRRESEGWLNTEVATVDAQKNGLPDGTFTHVATNIGFHVVPDSEAALNEAIRVLQPGGVLGFTTFHREVGWVGEVREAFASFPFEAPCGMGLQTTPWGTWSDVNWVRKTLTGKGLQDVKVDVFAFLSHVESADFFLANYGMMMDWIVNTSWSEELRRLHPKEEIHALVKEFLETKYGGEGWDLSWIALVASGRTGLGSPV